MAERFVAGRLNGVHAEPGTILGPKDITREWMVVLANDEHGCTVGYATVAEIEAAQQRAPQSVTEHRMPRRPQVQAHG